MKKRILNKINQELSDGIDSERIVVYLLTIVRKYIDLCSEKKDKYQNLYFYCNWVLHIKMDRTPAKNILKRFESNISGVNNLNQISRNFKDQEKKFYQFVDFKEELREFFSINDLPKELLENGRKWFVFIKLLVEVLMDCPLVNKKGSVSKFSYESGDDDKIRFRVSIKGLGSFKITLKEK